MSRVAPAGQFAHAPRGAEFGGVGWFCGPRFWWGETATFLLGVASAGQFAHTPRGAEFGGVGWFCGPRFWWGETATFLLGVAPAGKSRTRLGARSLGSQAGFAARARTLVNIGKMKKRSAKECFFRKEGGYVPQRN